ncbi:MAG: ANTAR domain-containing protein [Lachnospiraceae bacterium]|nr:ANTAR domain-containing protein [Lachnospiraceae bacterium]
MTNIVVVFPKQEEARAMKGLLLKNGYQVTAVCTTGAQAIAMIDGLENGILITGYKLVDMMGVQLKEYLPQGFEMVLLASEKNLSDIGQRDLVCLSMPLKVRDFLSTIAMMVEQSERRKRRLRAKPRERSEQEQKLILQAKHLLMERNHLSEEEAHRYLQKSSMDSGTNLTEAAQMVLAMMK